MKMCYSGCCAADVVQTVVRLSGSTLRGSKFFPFFYLLPFFANYFTKMNKFWQLKKEKKKSGTPLLGLAKSIYCFYMQSLNGLWCADWFLVFVIQSLDK